MPQLHILTGDGQARTVDLGDGPVTFGRSDENQVVLSEQKASRRHCTFRPSRGVWRVVDEQSSNGTWLGGKPVLSARLQPGDEIEIGDTVITFVAQPSELPKPDLVRPRRQRKIRMPWEALVAACALAAVAWLGSRALADEMTSHETAAWNRAVAARIEAVSALRDETAWKVALARLREELSTHEAARDAVTILDGAVSRGLPPAETETRKADWVRQLEQIDAGRARMTATERRAKLREVLARFAGDGGAVAAIAAALQADDAAARGRADAEAARLLADADQAVADTQFGRAFEDWTSWLASAPDVTRDAERAVAMKMGEARKLAQLEAGAAVAQYEAQLKEGRLAAAASAVDAAMQRLRGTGWDAWLAARTRRLGGSSGDGAPGTPVATGPRESDSARAARVAKERFERAIRSADLLAANRRFADAAAALSEAAGEVTDASLQADLHARAEDLTAAAAAVATLLAEIRAEPAHFGSVPVTGGTGRVTGATETEVLLGDAKGADPRPVGIGALPAAAFPLLLDRSKLGPESYVAAALLLREVGENDAYTAWMRKALAIEAMRLDASAVHARVLGVSVPVGGYFPHPDDPKAILPFGELNRLQNASKIDGLTKDLLKALDKLAATKQAKQVETVAKAYTQLEDARKFALELIYDEVKYFYPYRTRIREYQPVQFEVDKRVEAVREAWADKTSAKIGKDAALDKVLHQVEDLGVEIGFLGGDVQTLLDRAERIRMYVGHELSVQTYFESKEDLALLGYNTEMMRANTKVRGAISEPEREQVRITNEYRQMFGHRRALRLHEKLVAAARGHSEDMSTIGFFDHFNEHTPGKRTPWDRMLLAGYPNSPCSENIANGQGDAMGAHLGWCHSSGHHRNLLDPHWSEMGTGQSGRLWTQNFGYATGYDQVGGPGP